ncbi:MAG: hypothetical protein ACFFAS_21475 [Promethearchaeota archaeon]
MSDRYKNIDIKCPVCKTSKNLDLPRALFTQKEVGTIKIQIPPGAVCSDHQFIIFLDPEGKVRGYERIDLEMLESTIESKREVEGKITLKKMTQILGTYGIFSLIHAKVFNYPAFIVVNENFEYNAALINSIGNELLPERYRGGRTIHLYKETDYDKVELNIKDALLLDINKHISQLPWDEKLKFEENILEKAFEIFDEQEQLYLVQRFISNFIEEAECALKILESTDQISKKDLIKQISKMVRQSKINNYHLNLIIEFIKRRFSPKLTDKITK